MKAIEMKKALNGASVTVDLESYYYSGGFSGLMAYVFIDRSDSAWDKRIISVKAQCNDLAAETEPKTTQQEITNGFRSLPKFSGFYALKAECSVYLRDNYQNKEHDKALCLFAMVKKVIEKRNLGYVSNCELTQFLSALESLGAKHCTVTVDKKDYAAWRKERMQKLELAKANS